MKSLIRLRMSSHDAHYGGNLVDGARMLQLFGDVATELLIQMDGDEGLFKAYDNIEFGTCFCWRFYRSCRRNSWVWKFIKKDDFEAKKAIFQDLISLIQQQMY